jgi:HK97 family phage portal protein
VLPIVAKVVTRVAKAVGLAPISSGNWWWPRIREPYAGAWQRNDEWTADTVLAYHAVYACVTLVSSDIGKLRPRLVASDANDIWTETTSPVFSPVLWRPNRYQNHIQFKEWYITSKLVRGNTYILKQRGPSGSVVALYPLDPCRVRILISPDGSVFYSLSADNLSGLEQGSVEVPASEIIHDRMNCLWHPLVGVSPLFAAGLAACEGLKIQRNAATFFGNASQPGGVLTAPGAISDSTAQRLKEYWEAHFTADNAGAVAVVGDGLKFEPMRASAADSQMIEQLKWTAEVVCSCFRVPAHKVGVGPAPSATNVEALDQQYYSQCLQILIEEFEACMDEGLGLDVPIDGKRMGVELDLDGLLRMDTQTMVSTLADGVNRGLMTPNEARKKINSKPLVGGDTIYLQQQQYSIEALHERDQDQPFAKPSAGAPGAPGTPASSAEDVEDEGDQEQTDEEDSDEAEERALRDLVNTVIEELQEA